MRINCIITHQTLAISAPEAAEKSVSYLECAFYFLTPDWQGLTKTAFFTGTDGKNYSAVIQDGTCVVPWEAIAEPGFLRMSVAGFGQMSLIITTDIASLRMRDTIFGGDPSQAPSPDQYTQIMQVLSGKVDTDQGVQNSGKVLGINDSGKVEPMDNAGGGSSDLLWRPSVSESGDLSWTQDSSTDPPQAVNIMGPQGPAGKDGDPGQKGETGATGPAGKDGITPTIGENGNWYLGEADTGKPSRGEQGPKGPQGPQGGQGETGEQGPPGQTGPAGPTGATPNIQIGQVTTLEPGQDATASMTGTTENPLLNLGIPAGEQGPPGKDGTPGQQGEPGPAGQTGPAGPTGATPNIQIGTVQTLDPGQQATASMSGTPENPFLNLGIPKGENGHSETTVQQMQNTDTTVTLQPNILYIFPEMATLDVTIPQTDQEMHFFFDSGATATTFSLQAQGGGQIYTDAYSIDANMRYEVSVLHNVAYIKGVAISEA